MKKLKRLVYLVVISFLLLYYLQFGRKIEIKNTRIASHQNGYTECVSLVANKIYIADKEAFAEQVINTFIDNSFSDVKFSFDLGYPSDLNISVYMNEWDKNIDFEIYCVFDSDDDKAKLNYFEVWE